MIDSSAATAKLKAGFRQGWAEFADMGMLMSFAAASASGACSLANGTMPHWAAIAGAAVSAVYLTLPAMRALGRGHPPKELHPAVLRAAGSCAVRATQDGYDGIWAVHERDANVTRFMTEREFTDFRADLPEGTAIAVVVPDGRMTHVRRYVGGALSSTEEEPAHRVYDEDGTLVRAIDYDRGRYSGEREESSAPPGP